jgi:hypothetical protein
MQRRPILLAGLASVLAVAIAASVAFAGPVVTGKDGNTQSIDVLLSPKKLSKSKPTPAKLKVTTKTTTTTNPTGVPSPAIQAVVDFDKNATLYTKGIPTCDPNKLQNTSTDEAKAACGNAVIGSGGGSAVIPVGTKIATENTVITAFNGVPQGGKPVVLLHAYGTSPVQVTLVLVGTVSKFNKEGFGPRLDVAIPKLAGGTGALTDFTVIVNKKYRYKGKQRSFISVKCPKSKKLKARGAFTYADGETLVATSTQSCKQKK